MQNLSLNSNSNAFLDDSLKGQEKKAGNTNSASGIAALQVKVLFAKRDHRQSTTAPLSPQNPQHIACGDTVGQKFC